jgi:hypothetical protein
MRSVISSLIALSKQPLWHCFSCCLHSRSLHAAVHTNIRMVCRVDQFFRPTVNIFQDHRILVAFRVKGGSQKRWLPGQITRFFGRFIVWERSRFGDLVNDADCLDRRLRVIVIHPEINSKI